MWEVFCALRMREVGLGGEWCWVQFVCSDSYTKRMLVYQILLGTRDMD